MAVTTPVYATREDVKRSPDFKFTAREDQRIDRALQSAARNIDNHMHRVFYPKVDTRYYDWPNFQRAYPWRIWFDANELADVTVTVPVVTSGGNVILAANILWGPWNYGPPFTFLELDRSKSGSFGQGDTPQRDVAVMGTYGFSIDTDPAGTLATALTDTTGTTVVVSNSALATVGHILVIDSERMLVSDHATASTGLTIVSGGTTESAADNAITVTGSGSASAGETLLIDSERMLVSDVTGSVVTVKRAWDGTVLADHSGGATINAYRSLTVIRGALGTTAATHLVSAPLTVHRPPLLIRDLNIAEAGQRVLQETGGYSDPQGEEGERGLGTALADLWDEAETGYCRKARSRVI
jgi:hypothetical protein